MPTPNGEVRFTVKELLLELRQSVASIDAKLDQKADRERVHDLANRVSALEMYVPLRERLIEEFHDTQTDVSSLKSWRNRLGGGLAVVGTIVGANFLHLWFGI